MKHNHPPTWLPLFVACILGVFTLNSKADIVTDWNNAAIQAIRNSPSHSNPGAATRDFAMLNTAIMDSMSSINGKNQTYTSGIIVPSQSSSQAAAAQSAHSILTHLFPEQKASFDTLLNQHLASVTDSTSLSNGINVGNQVSQQIIQLRQNDGWDSKVQYQPSGHIGKWEPDPLHPDQQAWGPSWGDVPTWSIESGSAYRAPAPPSIDSVEYADAYNRVKELGGLNSTSRTQDQTDIAKFWSYDRANMGPPPILYNQIMQQVAIAGGNTPEENAQLFALASVAMADASIASWDSKFEYDYWRPLSGILNGDSDGNDLTEGDPDWVPMGFEQGDDENVTPPFPAYTSGHATMGAATFEMLALFYGTDEINIILYSDEMPGEGRTFTSFTQMMEENGDSRVYMGIHWDFDSTEGYVIGKQISQQVYTNQFGAITVPEPSSAILFSLALIPALIRRKRA